MSLQGGLLLLLLLPYWVASFHVTKYWATEEQKQDRVKKLPGQPDGVYFKQYAGYVTVEPKAGRALFYWLTEANQNASSKPLILWLNGGPGCSSIGYGAMEELGPFKIYVNGSGLYRNMHSWNRVANLLFLESPAGVGYSYSNTSTDYKTAGDNRTAQDSLAFLLGWFRRFPQYQSREFYISGESYAGHYVPQLAYSILKYNRRHPSTVINLKGFMVGNAVTDWKFDNRGIVDYYWSHSLISDQTYRALVESCPWKTFAMPPACQKTYDEAYSEIGNIDLHSVYTPVCLVPDPYQSRAGSKHWNPLWSGETGFDPCTSNYADVYFNRADVQKALHANTSGFIGNPWTICNYEILDNWKDKAYSVLPIYKELMETGLRIWVYSGDEDAMVPVTGTRYWLRHLNLSIILKWYPWYHDNQVGGWTQVYQGITFASVRGAGHEVPLLQPRAALALLTHFLEGKPLPKK